MVLYLSRLRFSVFRLADDEVDIFNGSSAPEEPDHRDTPRNGPKTWEVDRQGIVRTFVYVGINCELD